MGIDIKVRNTNVLVKFLQRKDQKVGAITIPGHLDQEIEHAIVLSVGPGVVSAAGGVSETHDLKEGDYVLVHAKQIRKNPAGQAQVTEKRMPIVLDGETYSVVDQSQIIAVITRPPAEMKIVN